MGDVFKALADPTRRAILDELVERNDQTLFELCNRLTMKHNLGSSRQAISQHLALLEETGLVTTRREGRYKFHHLDLAANRGGYWRYRVGSYRILTVIEDSRLVMVAIDVAHRSEIYTDRI